MAKSAPTPVPQRPVALPLSPQAIPAELKALDQWLVWRYFWLPDREHWDKPPLQACTLRAASTTNPRTWTTFAQALDAHQRHDLDGIGFVLTEDNGLVGVDLDHCRDADTGEIEPWALMIVKELDTYTEVSPSGTGLRLWIRGQLPPGRRKKGNVEMYSGGRYLTITGCHVRDTPHIIESRQAAIDALHARVFAKTLSPKAAPAQTSPPHPGRICGLKPTHSRRDGLAQRGATAAEPPAPLVDVVVT
jgi:putative DNA primase/helicase